MAGVRRQVNCREIGAQGLFDRPTFTTAKDDRYFGRRAGLGARGGLVILIDVRRDHVAIGGDHRLVAVSHDDEAGSGALHLADLHFDIDRSGPHSLDDGRGVAKDHFLACLNEKLPTRH